MNLPQHIRAAIVGVVSKKPLAAMNDSVAHVPPPEASTPSHECLGIISGHHILTCSHIKRTYGMLPTEVDLFSVWSLADRTLHEGVFGALYASSIGYLVLAPDTFSVEMSEAGGTESGAQLLIDMNVGGVTAVGPARLAFPASM